MFLHRATHRHTAACVDVARLVGAMRRVLDDNAEFRGLTQPGQLQRKVGLLMLQSMSGLREALADVGADLASGPLADRLDEFLLRWPPAALARATLAMPHAGGLDHALARLALDFRRPEPPAANDSAWASLFRRSRSP